MPTTSSYNGVTPLHLHSLVSLQLLPDPPTNTCSSWLSCPPCTLSLSFLRRRFYSMQCIIGPLSCFYCAPCSSSGSVAGCHRPCATLCPFTAIARHHSDSTRTPFGTDDPHPFGEGVCARTGECLMLPRYSVTNSDRSLYLSDVSRGCVQRWWPSMPKRDGRPAIWPLNQCLIVRLVRLPLCSRHCGPFERCRVPLLLLTFKRLVLWTCLSFPLLPRYTHCFFHPSMPPTFSTATTVVERDPGCYQPQDQAPGDHYRDRSVSAVEAHHVGVQCHYKAQCYFASPASWFPSFSISRSRAVHWRTVRMPTIVRVMFVGKSAGFSLLCISRVGTDCRVYVVLISVLHLVSALLCMLSLALGSGGREFAWWPLHC